MNAYREEVSREEVTEEVSPVPKVRLPMKFISEL